MQPLMHEAWPGLDAVASIEGLNESSSMFLARFLG